MRTSKQKLYKYVDSLSELQMIHALNKFADWQKYSDKVVEIEVDYNNNNSILCIDSEFFNTDKDLIRLRDLKELFNGLIFNAYDETVQEMFKCFDI